MGDRTGIQWTHATRNPMTGCTQVSDGCTNWYALTVAQRKTRDVYLAHEPVKDMLTNRADPFAPRFWENRLEMPLRWRRARRVFVNSMSDVFHAHFSLDMIQRVFEVMNQAHWHQFQVLTKRPERTLRFADRLTWSENIWFGTSIENMDLAHRADAVRATPAAVKFISAEPLLGPLDALDLAGVQWVIGGGESRKGLPPLLVGMGARPTGQLSRRRRFVLLEAMGGLTPKSGGRLLDDREWNEYPIELATS